MSANDKHHPKEWWKEISWSADVESLPGFAETKEILQETEEIVALDIPSADFFNRMHDKIMAGVAQTAIQPPAQKVWRRYHRWLKGSVASLALVTVLVTSIELQNSSTRSSHEDLSLNDAVSQSLEVEDSILVYQSKDDFLVDLASENFDDQSQGRLQGLVEAVRD